MESKRSSDPPLSSRLRRRRASDRQFPIPISSPEAIFSLPDEILIEILSRLPVKSLLRFRCVRKTWRNLISSEELAKTHLLRSKERDDFTQKNVIFTIPKPIYKLKSCSISSLWDESESEPRKLDYPEKRVRRTHGEVTVVGSCNGLVCLALDDVELYVWNPCTGKSRELPSSDFNTRDGSIEYGFGLDEMNDDYKVVAVFCGYKTASEIETTVKVYSSESNSWKSLGDFKGVLMMDDSGVFVNGKLHWGRCRPIESDDWDIISLDLSTEKYGYLEHPTDSKGYFGSLGALNGCLCLLDHYQRSHAEFRVMKEYGVKESWVNLLSIPYVGAPEMNLFSPPIYVRDNEEVLLKHGSKVVIYDPNYNTWRYPKIRNLGFCEAAVSFKESLISPGEYEYGEQQLHLQPMHLQIREALRSSSFPFGSSSGSISSSQNRERSPSP